MAEALGRLTRLIHWGLHRNETASLADWHIPAAHELESWSDLRAFDGTASLVQPMIRPLYDGRTVHEVLSALMGDFARDAREIVRETWREALDEDAWRHALKDGVVPGTAFAPVPVEPPAGLGGLAPAHQDSGGLDIRFAPDPFLRDGRHANSSWLQEPPPHQAGLG